LDQALLLSRLQFAWVIAGVPAAVSFGVGVGSGIVMPGSPLGYAR
jgi:hypothetical protein